MPSLSKVIAPCVLCGDRFGEMVRTMQPFGEMVNVHMECVETGLLHSDINAFKYGYLIEGGCRWPLVVRWSDENDWKVLYMRRGPSKWWPLWIQIIWFKFIWSHEKRKYKLKHDISIRVAR